MELIEKIFNPYEDIYQDYYIMMESCLSSSKGMNIPFQNNTKYNHIEIKNSKNGLVLTFNTDMKFDYLRTSIAAPLRPYNAELMPIFPFFTDETYSISFDNIPYSGVLEFDHFPYEDYSGEETGQMFKLKILDYSANETMINHIIKSIALNKTIFINIKRVINGTLRSEFEKINFVHQNATLVKKVNNLTKDIILWMDDKKQRQHYCSKDDKKNDFFNLKTDSLLNCLKLQCIVFMKTLDINHPILDSIINDKVPEKLLEKIQINELVSFLKKNYKEIECKEDIASFLSMNILYSGLFSHDDNAPFSIDEYIPIYHAISSYDYGYSHVESGMLTIPQHNIVNRIDYSIVKESIKKFKDINGK